jgi:uncharacterized protein (TIGR00251 family)
MRVKIIVKANFNKNDIHYDENFEAYRVFVKAKPKKGEANREIEKFLSKHFKKKVRIVSGFKSSRKVIELL